MNRGLPRYLVPILLLVGVCVVAYLALGGLGRGLGGLLGGQDSPGVPQTGGERLGPAFVASRVDNSGCPVDEPRSLNATQPIYAGIEESNIPTGTSVFARLYREGIPIEDTDELTTEDDLRACVWFQFDPGSGGFEPGDYQVELVVNGQSAGRVPFEVAAEGNGSPLPEIGRLYTSTRVDEGGCPVDDISAFYPDEDIYLATDLSRIPRGTEIFARLIHESQPVEDTQVVTAGSDMNTCVWFVFEPGARGFDPGRYQADLYVNGSRHDSIQFTVR